MEFSKILKNERTKQNLSQSDLATKLHVARQTISKWETGESYPNLDVLLSISEILNVSTDVLLKGENNIVAETISKKVSRNKVYKIWALVFLIFVTGSAMGVGILTYGRATQSIWIDRMNPFLPTRIGYAAVPISKSDHDLGNQDVTVYDDPFGDGDWLKFSTGLVDKDNHWVMVRHKGSYVSRAKLITKDQLPLAYRDLGYDDGKDTYTYKKELALEKSQPKSEQYHMRRSSWNPFK